MPREETKLDPVTTPLCKDKVEDAHPICDQKDVSICDTDKDEGEGSSPSSPLIRTDIIYVDTIADTSVEEEEECPVGDIDMPEGVSIETEVVTLNDDDDEGSKATLDTVPSYHTDLEGILADREFSMLTGKPINDARPRKSCFNCLGDHNVTDCPEPQDYARIAANRKKHGSTRTSSVRYHEDCENKFGQFQPGRLSAGLRHALGLRGKELPIFVYRMRVLGYPPGWLCDAEVHQADVKMFDDQGESATHSDAEGEAKSTTVKYQPDKLISFPGFNDALPRGARDECHRYNLPPMQQQHQRSEFLHYMNLNRAQVYRKKKLKRAGDKVPQASTTLPPLPILDMDVDEKVTSTDIEFNPPLPKEPQPPPPPEDTPPPPPPEDTPPPPPPDDTPPPPPPPDDTPPLPPLPPPEMSPSREEGEASEDSQDSVSGLELQRQRILTQLQDTVEGSGNSNCSSKDSSQNNSQDDSQNEKPSEQNRTLSSKSKRHHRSHSKGFQFGAHIPQSNTPFMILPDVEKWTVDVSDHIVFDNLPDALGTWDKMKDLMGQVKQRMNQIHTEDDE